MSSVKCCASAPVTIRSFIIYIFEKIKKRHIRTRPKESYQATDSEISAEELVAVVSIAIYMEREQEIPILTLRHIEQDMSPWVVATKPSTMRST